MLAEKELFLEEIKSKIDLNKGFILARYKGMKANKASAFRDHLNKIGSDFFALKKRVFLIAAKQQGETFELSELEGHVGLILVGEDFVSSTKAVYAFGDENEGMLDVLGGHFEGRKCSAQEMKEISKLPSHKEMQAQFLGILEAPMAETLGTINAILTSIVHCLDQKSNKES